MNIKIRTFRAVESSLDLNHKTPLNGLSTSALSLKTAAERRRPFISGFTLLETIVATLLAAIMLPAFYAALACGFSILQASRENVRATQIMVQRMEAIRLSSFKTIQDPAAYPTNTTDYFYPSGPTNGKGAVYTITYDCAPGPSTLPPSYRTNMMLITVTATWQSGKVQQTRSMQSYVARYGIQRYVCGS